MTEKLILHADCTLLDFSLGKPTLSSLAVLARSACRTCSRWTRACKMPLQVCLDSGAKKVLLPITSAADIGTAPADLIGCFNLIFYQSAEDACL